MARVRLDPSSRMPLPSLRVDVERELSALKQAIGARPTRFVELCARSHFSFLSGASAPEALVRRASALGYQELGLTDRDGLYGMVRAHAEAKKLGVRLVVGCELTLEEGLGSLTVHVASHRGYENLCALLTESHARHPKGARAAAPRSREGEAPPRNLFAGLPIASVLGRSEGLWAMADARHPVAALREAFGGRLSIAVTRCHDGADRSTLARALDAARTFAVPLVATNRPLYAEPHERPVLDVLQCIRDGHTLDDAGTRLALNAEAYLKGDEDMGRLFAAHPEALARARAVAEACRFSLDELEYRFPDDDALRSSSSGETSDERLRRLTWEGARARYPDAIPEAVRGQVERELRLIEELDVAPYFLSVHSIVAIARERDILCQGRGSAANSAVCFCLGITAVDPARANLLFERFLSAERREPPDIDVDFEHERREEVIQEIYRRYGRERAAMVSEVICYRGKSALREVGKAFGLSLEQVDGLARAVSYGEGPATVPESRLRAEGFSAHDPRLRHVLAMAQRIQGFPRHLSIHVGGFVLSAEPLQRVAPVEPATMKDRTIVPWDKDDLDELGFFKIDVLALGMLTAIRKALDLVTETTGWGRGLSAIDKLARIPPEDPAVYEALSRADTVGVFQIESRAQMAMLPRLRPRCFYDLVIEVAIVRPGPIQGGMVHPYLRRRNGEERCEPPHPVLAPILARTLGVPLFQEQVMQIAIEGAGYTGGEADQLRRDMAAWRKNGNLARHEARLKEGFAARGIPEAFAERLYKQIQGFGEYGFPESHAASFALLVYASAWLKVHHPAELAAALLNSQPMGFYSASTILKDAERHGVRVLPIRVESSGWDAACLVGEGGAVSLRVGLREIKGLAEAAGRRIERARRDHPFASVEDLAARAELGKKDLDALAESGALDDLSGGRRAALWQALAPRPEPLLQGVSEAGERARFAPLGRAEQLVLDYRRTGLSVDDHPMRLMRAALPPSVADSVALRALATGAPVTTAGLVICRQRPMTASGVVFVTMEDEHGFINLVLWAKVFERFRRIATTSAMLLAHGKVESSSRVDAGAGDGLAPAATVYVVVTKLEALSPRAIGIEGVPSQSRDFH